MTARNTRRIILVSNRLPITVRRDRDGGVHVARSAGGLVAGLAPVHQREESLWVGNPGAEPDAALAAELAASRMVPVSVPPDEQRGFYEGFANSALWPLFHYALDRCNFSNSTFEAYRRVNERFADAIAAHAHPGDVVWVHDYQLMLVPRLLRERIPGVRIGFFLHIPFPSAEIMRVLPQRGAVLDGLLGADLIGLHTRHYADHVLRSFHRFLGVEGNGEVVMDGARPVRVEAHPLGADVPAMREAAFSTEAERALSRLHRRMRDRKVILGVDRLDYTKGLPLKLEAFRTFMEDNPRWRNRVVFLQVAVPSRENISSYKAQKEEVERLVGQINGIYGNPGQVPIQYIYRSFRWPMLGALYRTADVAFISPIRDGMNLVAKEYVACHADGTGALVLSEFAGASVELPGAILVNPWDVEGTAAQLRYALEMGEEERSGRMMNMHRHVVANDVHRWVDGFLASLLEAAEAVERRPVLLEPATLGNS